MNRRRVVLTTHPAQYSATPYAIHWGASDPKVRGPIVATLHKPESRNAIGTHNGPYAIYRAVSVAKGLANEEVDLGFTAPSVQIGPFPSWLIWVRFRT